jgi:hypothetical protein
MAASRWAVGLVLNMTECIPDAPTWRPAVDAASPREPSRRALRHTGKRPRREGLEFTNETREDGAISLDLSNGRVGGFGQVAEALEKFGRLPDEEAIAHECDHRIHRGPPGRCRPDD